MTSMNNNIKKRKIAKVDERQNMKATTTKIVKNAKDDVFASCSFSSLGLHPTLCEQLKERMGYEAPTLIQAEAIPIILSGRHVLVKAETGSGKTVTYLAPIVHRLQKIEPRISRSDGTFALVLVPTQELCMQVYEILQKLLRWFHWIVPGYLTGGENKSKEKARLRKGISILVATPGRLLDHLQNTASFKHSNICSIIFDEADRILELGLGKKIEEILNLLGSMKNSSSSEENPVSRKYDFQRQNLLLSATLNAKVNHLAQMSLENPVMVGLDDRKIQPNPSHDRINYESQNSELMISSSGDYKLPAQLVQRYVQVPCGSRLMVLLSVLKNLFERGDASQKVVLFFSTRATVDFHYMLLNEFQWPPNSELEAEVKQLFLKCKIFRLHGSMKREDRRTAFQAFKTEKSALLLSTDVSARGLDFPKVKCIIQYDSPGEATEYVHRVGRTARLGEKGDSLLFLQPIEMDYLEELQKHGVVLAEYSLLKVLDSFPLQGQRHHNKKVDFDPVESHPWVLYLQRALESLIISQPEMKTLAKDAFCSWVRSYTAHRGELKKIFMVRKLHLGHVARSFALKEEPSLVGGNFQMQSKKRKKEQKQRGLLKRFRKT